MVTIRKFTTLACVVVLLLAGFTTACTSGDDQVKHTVKVDKPISALFGASATFDLSFEGDVQPAVPIDIELKLEGKFLPAGVRPDQALLYTPASNGDGWRLLPAIVEGNVLKAQVPHLSPKSVAYMLDEPLRSLVSPSLLGSVQNKDCKSSVKSSLLGEVRITGATGWSATKPDSPIQACLDVTSDVPNLYINNRVNHILSVAATDGVSLHSAGTEMSDDEKYSLAIAKALAFNSPKTKAFLTRNGTLGAELNSKNLPATVELRAEPNVFLAEAAWGSLNFLVGIATGKDVTETVALAKQLLDAVDVIGCLTNALSSRT